MMPMKDLYDRLKAVGFDRKFVRSRFLPDWWNDSLATVPANRVLAESAIAKMLKLPLSTVKNSHSPLTLPEVVEVRLKRRKGTTLSALRPSIYLAQRGADSIARVITPLATFSGLMSASDARTRIVNSGRAVNLESLLEFAWSCGIIVIHISEFPAHARKFSGIAMFTDSKPVVVLGFRSDSPPWLAFHLAHELAHIFLGHVGPTTSPLADADLDSVDGGDEETQADKFACELLTGLSRPTADAVSGLTGPRLAVQSKAIGARLDIDPGIVALVYGRNARRMGAAQNALSILGMDSGAKRMIADSLKKHLPSEIPEHTARYVALATAA